MTKKEIMKAVVGQIMNQMTNDLLEEWRTSSFEVWCEDQFEDEEDPEACYAFAKEIAPLVDSLTWKLGEFSDLN